MEAWEPKHDAEKIDLAFIIDCTGSMGSYIKQVQSHVQFIAETISRTAFNVRLGLIEYRDHPPQDRTFVTRVHDFTGNVGEMKQWVDGMSASGGGDWPESVADGLYEAGRLSYRKQATKMCVLIADAPPHGLDLNGDGFPNGCPKGLDPLTICHTLAEKGITLYCIGCEPSVNKFRDFLMALSAITGGQYVPLRHYKTLTKLIINSALEEVSLEKLMGVVSDEIHLQLQKLKAEKKTCTIDELTHKIHYHLKITNNQCRQVHLNEEALPPLTENGKKYSAMKQMSQAQMLYKESERGRYREVYSRATVDEVVELMESMNITLEQTGKLVTKYMARNKIPVTHCEETNRVVVGEVPYGV